MFTYGGIVGWVRDGHGRFFADRIQFATSKPRPVLVLGTHREYLPTYSPPSLAHNHLLQIRHRPYQSHIHTRRPLPFQSTSLQIPAQVHDGFFNPTPFAFEILAVLIKTHLPLHRFAHERADSPFLPIPLVAHPSAMGLSRSTRIITLLVIDTLFFFLEIIVGYAVHSLALVADSFHMVALPPSYRRLFFLREGPSR